MSEKNAAIVAAAAAVRTRKDPPPAEEGPGAACKTNLFCPVCGHEFRPEEIGRKPHCRRCGYLESCCNPE